jgi:hypothetical protein
VADVTASVAADVTASVAADVAGGAAAAVGGVTGRAAFVATEGAAAAALTVTPGRSFNWPSITTWSPAESPDSITATGPPPLAVDTLIGTIWALLPALTT